MTRSESIEVLNKLKGTRWLVGMLLYCFSLRPSENLKNIGFGYNQIRVRDSKGEKDYSTMLPKKLVEVIKWAFD
ncbi:hypothetical protein [Chloroherpeton thalassium]|uniref:hypothetical protein n=1 Tax=Chloroherpeton thalassium TaxID=100716 RepID=UPI000674C0E2|nr:hypothetical protein [Chloroherpeton thalassium]